MVSILYYHAHQTLALGPESELISPMLYALILFAVTYVLMLTFSKYRPYIALGSALVFILTGMLPLDQILGAIDFNVLMMIAGTMGLVQLFIDSKMPARLADMIMAKVPNVQMAAVALALFAGIISAFVDNVATVLMVAPIAMEICKKLKTNPVPFIIGIAVSSNLQGAATLVGDTTAIMLGSYANMSFLDFFFYKGRPGIFWAVELGAVASACILAFLFRKEKGAIPKSGSLTPVTDYVPTVLLVGMIVLLISASFIPNKPDITNGLICLSLMAIGLVYNYFKNASILEKLERHDLPFSLNSIVEHINDVAGIRVICSYIDDIYTIADALLRQDDVTLIDRKDYIANPKPNGYRSLHLIVSIPVFFADQKKEVRVEVQIRTIAMDFWASLEHQLKYKQEIPNQQEIIAQLKECADVINDTDEKMLGLRQQIETAADAPSEEEVLFEKLSRLDINLD